MRLIGRASTWSQVRAGRGVDSSTLRVASGRTRSGAEVGAVLEPGDSVQELLVGAGKVASNAQPLQGFGAIATPPAVTASAPAGAGFDAASNRSGFSRVGRACRSLFFQPSYSHSTDHYIYDCWEKWHSTRDSRDWIYNRYTLFDAGNGTGSWKGQTVDATIRFRPWKGYESRVSGGPYDYFPKPTSKCTTSTVTLGAAKVVSASISIPYVQCSAALSVYPRSDTHAMGTDWNGRTTAQVYLDSAANFIARSGSAAPVFADYVWMEIQYCWGPGNCGLWNPSEYETWRDSGW